MINRDVKRELLRIAATMARREGFLTDDEDLPRSHATLRAMLRKQDEHMADLAFQLGRLAAAIDADKRARPRTPR